MKLTLDDLNNLQNEASAVNTINVNNDKIEQALENTISRDGTAPNTMEGELDMNLNRILNLPEPLHPFEPLRKIDRDNFIIDLDTRVADAANSAIASAASATAAATSEENAATSEANADASEAAAAASAAAAAGSASDAADSADAAAASAAQAQAALDITALGIPSDATGDVSATNVQAAIAELASEKATKAELTSNVATINTSIGTKLNSSAVSTFMLTVLDDTTASAARTTLGIDKPTAWDSTGDGFYDITTSTATLSSADVGKVFLVTTSACFQVNLPSLSSSDRGWWVELILWGQPSSSFFKVHSAGTNILYGAVTNLQDFYSHGYGERLRFRWTGLYWTVDVLSNSYGGLSYVKKINDSDTSPRLSPPNIYQNVGAVDVANTLPSLGGSSDLAFIPRVAGQYSFQMEARLFSTSPATGTFYGGVAIATTNTGADLAYEYERMPIGDHDRKFSLTHTMSVPQMTSGIYGQVFATSQAGRMYLQYIFFTAKWLGR